MVFNHAQTPLVALLSALDAADRPRAECLAGAGVKRGFVYSESDSIGAYPASRSHTPADMAATIFWALGLDPASEIHDRLGRPIRLADGEPITGVFA